MRKLALVCLVASSLGGWLPAQTIYLFEDFDSTFPPAGWGQIQLHPNAQGWIHSPDGRAWHQSEIATPSDATLWTTVDLRGATEAYVHFDLELRYPTFQANHPNSHGAGVTEIVMRPLGGTSWTVIWTDCRTTPRRDMMTAVVPLAFVGRRAEIGIRYYGDYDHELWLDRFQVDDSRVPPAPLPPPPTFWTYMSLPASTAVAPYTQDFESGAAPAEMALSALDWTTHAPDPEAWCAIANTMGTYSGAYCLEMGRDPQYWGGYTKVLNAMVLSLDLSMITDPQVTFSVIGFMEQRDDEDGVWVSNDGVFWYQVLAGWGQFPSTWQRLTVDLTVAPVDFQQPVYIMFSQVGEAVYGTTDGVGIDDIVVDSASAGSAPPWLTVTDTGYCPAGPVTPVTFEVTGATPGGMVVLLYGAAGSYVSTGRCAGTVVDIAAPSVGYVWAVSSGSIDCFHVPNLPAAGCGLTVQAVDVASCMPSNPVVL